MRRRARIALPLVAVIVAASGSAFAADVSDTQALGIVQRHCGPCHAGNPTHPAFDRPPKNIVLETTADLKKYAARVLEQVEDRTMPLGNETDMTDEEREALVRWINALK